MVLDVHVLGTASARPTPDRAVSGSLVKGPDGIAVIDAGEGFQTRYAKQRRRLKAHSLGESLKPSGVDVLAFTHGHLDHTWGALPWLQSMDLENRQQPLLILGPTSSEVIEALINGTNIPDHVPPADLGRQYKAWFSLGAKISRFPIRWILGDVPNSRWIEIDPSSGLGFSIEKMPQPKGWSNSTLTPLPTTHTVPSCGWMIQQHAKAGKFDRQRADDLGLTTKERAMLARGEDVTTAKGGTLESAWFRGGERAPVSVLISGDTATSPPAWTEDVAPTLLVHEATFLNEQHDKADEHQHSTAAGAVASALAVGAESLALTHYSNRIKSSDEPLAETKSTAGALPVVALNDSDRMVVEDDGRVNHLSWNGSGWASLNIKPNR